MENESSKFCRSSSSGIKPKLVLLVTLLIILVIMIGAVFDFTIIHTVREQKILEDKFDHLNKRIENIFTGLTPNNPLTVMAHLLTIREFLNKAQHSITDFDLKSYKTNAKLQAHEKALVNSLMNKEIKSMNEFISKISGDISHFQSQADSNYSNLDKETERNLLDLNYDLKYLDEKVNKSLTKTPYRVRKRLKLTLQIGWPNPFSLLQNGDLAIGLHNNSIQIWNIETGTLKKAFNGHKRAISALETLPNGNLISASEDETIKIWTEKGHLVKEISAFGQRIVSTACFGNNNFATMSDFGDLMFWTPNRISIEYENRQGLLQSMVILPKTDILVTASKDGSIKMWSAEGELKKEVLERNINYHSVARDFNGGFVSVSIVYFWSESGDLRDSFSLDHQLPHIRCVLPNGDLVLSGMAGEIVIYERTSGVMKIALGGHKQFVSHMMVLPNGGWVTASHDLTIKIWST